MKKSSLLRVLVVVGVSALLIANLLSVVSATDDFSNWEGPNVVNTAADNTSTNSSDVSTTNTVRNDTSTNSVDITTVDTSNTNNSSISTGSATTTLNTSTDNTNEKNEVNSLAYTGIEDTNILAVVIILGAIIAGYSLKKVRDYNNL